MQNYEFDQEGLGIFYESNKRSKRKPLERGQEIKRAMNRSVILEIIFGALTMLVEVTGHEVVYYLPFFVAMFWMYVWMVLSVRCIFAFKELDHISMEKINKQEILRSVKHLFVMHAIVMVWYAVNFILYSEEVYQIVIPVIVGIATTMISYALSYMSCSIKRIRWWQFNDYHEEYW